MESVMQVIKDRRSIRRFKDTPVSRSEVETILEAARLAPSWCNLQCWRFIVVDNTATIKALGKPVCDSAPVVVVACALKAESGDREGKLYYLFDMGIAVEHMVLQAAAMGLGTCIIGWFEENGVKELLGISDAYEVVALLPIGVPDESPDARPRKSLQEIASWSE